MTKNKESIWISTIREIVIIIVGVLIAFSLNNWGENQKKKSVQINILKDILITLDKDLSDINMNIQTYKTSIESSKLLIRAFDNNLPFHDSLIFHFSTQTYNMIFYRNDSPYEVLKSKGFDLISNESLRLSIIDLYGVQYRSIDYYESELPQFQSFDYIFEYIKHNFKKSDIDNYTDLWLVSIEPKNYDLIKQDPQYRLLLEHASFWRQKTINKYELTKSKIIDLQKLIRQEISELE